MERLDRNRLTMDDQYILVERVLPEYKRWMLDYPFGSALFGHGLDGVTKWGAEGDGDIRARYEEWLAYQRELYGSEARQ